MSNYIFFYNFFHYCKLYCLKLVYCKNYFSLAKVFVLRLFKVVANQTECSRLEQRSVIKFLVAEKCNPCETYRKMYDVFRETYFIEKKMFTNWLKIGLS